MAHSFGEPVQLPLPYGLYIYSAMGALVVSFLLFGLFMRPQETQTTEIGRAQQARKPWPKAARLCAFGIRVLLLGSLLLAIATGLLGSNDPFRNFNMTYFWIVFALGGVYLSMLVGNWYAWVNPWKTVTSGLSWLFTGFDRGRFDYPLQLGYWPACALYFAFISLELFSNTTPFALSVVLLIYTGLNIVAVAIYGAKDWYRYGEFFGVMFGLVSKVAPLRLRLPQEHGRKLVLRWPFAGLLRQRVEHSSQLIFLLFMLSSTAFDGLRDTSAWFNLFWADPFHWIEAWLGKPPLLIYPQLRNFYIGYEWGWLLISPFLYLGVFFLFLWLGTLITHPQAQCVSDLAMRFGFSLLPITLVYHATHYYTLLLSQGVKIRGLISDPFGWQWNLFGTAISGRLPILPPMEWIWYSQVGLILLGHIASVWLAHAEALRFYPNRRQAALSQLPILVLMVLFTGIGLWILAQPLKG